MASALLPTLRRKREVDSAIRDTLDKVLVLRFGRAADAACLHLDDIVSPSLPSLPLPLPSVPYSCSRVVLYKIIFLAPFLSCPLAKSSWDISKFAMVALVDMESEEIQVYIDYFDITLVPATIFFFNAHHMKMDSG
ncbi:hypothetical protein PR202_gb16016 [Eleusine coracana subsp. coracana]|uniref:Thioredoxin-like protein 4B n=1 Tax=Eleusine coracana subsp. coracana TaxID=191504 RepID=A0AAV5EZE9_ELECO|nr:hypothetical protein PR202_gb16016 [Eleusine coracana subsp. coracana]